MSITMSLEKEINLIRDIGRTKRVKRSGWVREGITEAESVADHSYRVAVMAMVFGARLGVNTDKLVKMALLHDLAEGITGDLVTERGVNIDSRSSDEKEKLEAVTLNEIFANVPNEGFIEIYKEIAGADTAEAKILKQLERLEMAVQALEYEEQYGKDLSEFFENASQYISQSYLKEMLDVVKNLRPK